MADSKISQLPDGGVIQATDEFVVARSGSNKKITGDKISFQFKDDSGTITQQTAGKDLDVRDASSNSVLKTDTVAGSVQAGRAGEDGVNDIKDASDIVQVRMSSNGDSFINGNLGVGNKNPLARVHVSGGVVKDNTQVNASTYIALITDNKLCVDYTATGIVTITLPSVLPNGFQLVVTDTAGNATTNNITIDTEGVEKINGLDTYLLDANYDSVKLNKYNGNWYAI